MVELPPDIWFEVLQYLPDSIASELYSLNRVIFRPRNEDQVQHPGRAVVVQDNAVAAPDVANPSQGSCWSQVSQ